jgi:hypothetical protein
VAGNSDVQGERKRWLFTAGSLRGNMSDPFGYGGGILSEEAYCTICHPFGNPVSPVELCSQHRESKRDKTNLEHLENKSYKTNLEQLTDIVTNNSATNDETAVKICEIAMTFAIEMIKIVKNAK